MNSLGGHEIVGIMPKVSRFVPHTGELLRDFFYRR